MAHARRDTAFCASVRRDRGRGADPGPGGPNLMGPCGGACSRAPRAARSGSARDLAATETTCLPRSAGSIEPSKIHTRTPQSGVSRSERVPTGDRTRAPPRGGSDASRDVRGPVLTRRPHVLRRGEGLRICCSSRRGRARARAPGAALNMGRRIRKSGSLSESPG